MNKFIKLKKRMPAEKWHSIESLKRASKDPDNHDMFFWKNGKINFINAVKANRYLVKIRKYGRKNLKEVLRGWSARKPNILKGAHFDENGKIVCNKCGSKDFEFVFHGDGEGFFEYGFKCENCKNEVYELLRFGMKEYKFID